MIASKAPPKKTPEQKPQLRKASKVAPPKSGWYQYRHICASLKIALRTAKKYVVRGRIPSPEYRGGRAYWSTLAMDELLRLGVQPDGTYKVNPSRQSKVAKADYAERHPKKRTKSAAKGGVR